MSRWIWLSLGVIALDQLTKYLAMAGLALHDPVPLTPFLNLTLTYNVGAAFSFLNQAGGWQRWLFIGLAVAVSVGILFWLRRLSTRASWTAVGLALVLGGAVGNLIDRLYLGHVVDFIDLYYGRWHWPAFNVADAAITVGALIVIIRGVLDDQPLDSRLGAYTDRRE
jgi:signal peptidase II